MLYDWYLDTFTNKIFVCIFQAVFGPSNIPGRLMHCSKYSANCLWRYECIVVVDKHIDTTHLTLIIEESEINFRKTGTCRFGSFMLVFNVKMIKALLLLAAIHNYASLVYNNLPNIYKIVVCNTQTHTEIARF